MIHMSELPQTNVIIPPSKNSNFQPTPPKIALGWGCEGCRFSVAAMISPLSSGVQQRQNFHLPRLPRCLRASLTPTYLIQQPRTLARGFHLVCLLESPEGLFLTMCPQDSARTNQCSSERGVRAPVFLQSQPSDFNLQPN